MSWLFKLARTEEDRIKRNINKLEKIRSVIYDLSYFAVSFNRGGFQVLKELLCDQVVKSRPKVFEKLKSALLGENNQKVVLDAPTRFQRIMREAEKLVMNEIGKEKKELKKLRVQESSQGEKRTVQVV